MENPGSPGAETAESDRLFSWRAKYQQNCGILQSEKNGYSKKVCFLKKNL